MGKQDWSKEISQMMHDIRRELVLEFGKSWREADALIQKAKVYESLNENPLGLHESPYDWALIVLTINRDTQALKEHYYA